MGRELPLVPTASTCPPASELGCSAWLPVTAGGLSTRPTHWGACAFCPSVSLSSSWALLRCCLWGRSSQLYFTPSSLPSHILCLMFLYSTSTSLVAGTFCLLLLSVPGSTPEMYTPPRFPAWGSLTVNHHRPGVLMSGSVVCGGELTLGSV